MDPYEDYTLNFTRSYEKSMGLSFSLSFPFYVQCLILTQISPGAADTDNVIGSESS